MTNFMSLIVALDTILGALIAFAGLVFIGLQFKKNTKISENKFLLEVTKLFAVYDDIHVKLLPGGEWCEADQGPESPQERARVYAYLRLMERCEILMKEKCIEPNALANLYSYRVENVLQQAKIMKMIEEEPEDWSNFINLTKRLKSTHKIKSTLPKGWH